MSDEEEEIEEVEEEEEEEEEAEEEQEEAEEEEEEAEEAEEEAKEEEEEAEEEEEEAEEKEEEEKEEEEKEEEEEEKEAEEEEEKAEVQVNVQINIGGNREEGEEDEEEKESGSDSSSSSSSSSSSDEDHGSGEDHGGAFVVVVGSGSEHHHKQKAKKKKKKKKKSKEMDPYYPEAGVAPPMPVPEMYPPYPEAGVAPPMPAPEMYPPYPEAGVAPPMPAPGMYPPPHAGMAAPMPVPDMYPPPQEEMGGMKLWLPATLNPTIKPYENFNVEADTEALREAMKGTGTEEKTIIEIISHRANYQRQEIEKMFKTMYGKDLIKDLCSELSGHLEETVTALFKSPTYYDTWTLHKAMKGMGTDDDVLIEILATRNNRDIAEINECYKEMYGKTLEDKISSETSGKYKRLLVSMCQANRNELSEENAELASREGIDAVIDREQAREDAKKLYKAGEKKLGTDESMFIQILGLRNFFQIIAITEEYNEIAKKSLQDSIKSEMSGNLAKGLTAIVDSSIPPVYFAKKLKKAMSGVGTDDSTLIRIIVSRSEIDLEDIKRTYKKEYDKSLIDAISSDTSGKYKKLLLAVCGK